MIKNIFKILAFFILGIFGGIFADQILWPYFVERPLFFQYQLEKSPIYLTERKEIIIQENTALKEAIERGEKVVIPFKGKTKKGKILEGTALILTSDGLLITLAELVPRDSEINFFLEEEIIKGRILKRDLKKNLALIKIEKNNLPTLPFSDFEKIKLGERVFLIGVLFEKGKPKKIVNEGIVKYFKEDLIETNIFEEEKLVGSILFDLEGKILGINKIDQKGKIIALPIPQIKAFVGF